LLLPVIVGVMALTLDGGLMYVQRQQAQSVADAAALSGAYQLYNGSNFSVAQSSAIAIASQTGFTVPSSNVTQPQTGYIAGPVPAAPPRSFSALWGSGTNSVGASATARGTSSPYSPAAILVLAASGPAVMFSGSASVTASGGSVVVDSTASSSILSSSTGS